MADRRYALLGHTHTGLGTSAAWGSITGTLSAQTDLQSALDAKLATSGLLAAILAVDGAASGIDADLLDGNHASAFALASHTHVVADVTDLNLSLYAALADNETVTGSWTFSGTYLNFSGTYIRLTKSADAAYSGIQFRRFGGNVAFNLYQNNVADPALYLSRYDTAGTYAGNVFSVSNAGVWSFDASADPRVGANLMWHAGNDGASSGLDADLLDGQHGSYYAAASSLASYLPLAGGTMTGYLISSKATSASWGAWATGKYHSTLPNNASADWVLTWTQDEDSDDGGLQVLNKGQELRLYGSGLGHYLGLSASGISFSGTLVSLSTHTHSYLPLSGGTLTGALDLQGTANQLRVYETDAADTADYGMVEVNGNELNLYGRDNSAATWRRFLAGNITTGIVTLGNSAGIIIDGFVRPNSAGSYGFGSTSNYYSYFHSTTYEFGANTDTTLSRLAAGKLGVEGKAVLQHDGSYTSGQVTFSTADASGGTSGDIWFKYTA